MFVQDMFPDASFLALQRASSQLPQFLDASLLLKVRAALHGMPLIFMNTDNPSILSSFLSLKEGAQQV